MMILFLLTFFLIYGGSHFYFFLTVKAATPLGILSGLCLAIFLIFMVLAPILVGILEREGMDVFARVLAYAGYLWMGFLFLFISASIAIDIYHQFLHVAGFISQRDFTAIIPTTRTALVLSFAWGTITALYGYFEARGIRTERVVINTQKIPRAVGKLTIVQISDVHLGLIVREERLRRITAAICAADPDILVSTGDLVDGQINRMQGLAEVMRDIQPKFGKFAVTGNHEVYAGLNQALEFTERAGFNVLRGNSVVAGGLITVIGVDDPAIERVDRLELTTEKRLLSTVPHDRFTLLLKHRPAVHRDSLGLVDLQLSGHVHKGQIFPFNLVTHLFYPVKTGYSLYPQNFALYVSRGTGTWGPPIRFMAPPEITVIELRHPNQADSNMQVTV